MKTVHVTLVKGVEVHPNAENLEILSFSYGKKKCVVPKGKFTVGQKVIRILPESFVAKKENGRADLHFSWVGQFYGDCERENKHYLNRHRKVQVKNIRGVESYGIVIALNDIRENIVENLKKISKIKVNKHFWDNPKYNTLLSECLGVAISAYQRDILDGTEKRTVLPKTICPMITKKFPTLKSYDENGKRIYPRVMTNTIKPISMAHIIKKRIKSIRKQAADMEDAYNEKYL